MSDPVLRIYSYLPNPRVWKSLIAAEICGVEVEVRGDKPSNLANWLWDFDARKLSPEEMGDDSPHLRIGRRGFTGKLFKTDEFLEAHPYGTVPAAFDPSGGIGIFESNSILRAVVRNCPDEHGLYGANGSEASRIDSFLDASLVFAREAQVYILAMPDLSEELYDRMGKAFEFYLSGIESALNHSSYLAGETLTIADIGFACDFGQFLRERSMYAKNPEMDRSPISHAVETDFPNAYAHLHKLTKLPEFAKHMSSLIQDLPKPVR